MSVSSFPRRLIGRGLYEGEKIMENEQLAPELEALTPEERALIAEGDTAPDAEPEQPAAEHIELRNDPAPILTAKAPDQAHATLARCAEFEEEASRRFEEGEITAREYRDFLQRAADAREQARWDQRKAELASEMTQQAQDRAWYSEVDRFMATTGVQIARSHSAKIAFDEHVKAVTADPANHRLSDRAQLDKAYKLFMQDVGGALGVAQRAAAYDAMGDQGGRAVGGSDFAALDRLAETDPMAYERAVARMSPEEVDLYGR